MLKVLELLSCEKVLSVSPNHIGAIIFENQKLSQLIMYVCILNFY